MGLLLLLPGGLLLLVAGFELWSFLTGSIFSLIMKAGLLQNISVDPNTKISVTSAVINISLWPQLWKFLRTPTREKLLIFTLSSVRLLVVTTTAEEQQLKQGQTSDSPPLWQLIDTSSGLKDIRHPMWSRARVWIPRLIFLCRCVHAVEFGVDAIEVNVVKKDQDSDKPVLSIQHASAFVKAIFDPLSREVACSIVFSRRHPTKLAFQGLDDMTAELGRTEITVRVPVCHGPEDLRAPIPSAYSVVIDLIRVNFDLEHLWQAVLVQKQQQQHCTETPYTSSEAAIESTVESGIARILTILRLAEICPSDFRFEIVVLEVNITDKVPPRCLGSVCTLGLNRITVVLSVDVDDDSGTANKDNEDYPVVARKADLALGPLVIRLNEVGDTTTVAPMLKLNGLKVNAEGTLSADVTHPSNSEELDESDCNQPCLYFRSTISGGNGSLEVMISERIEPWVTSCCILYDRAAASSQGTSPVTYLTEETSQTEEQSAMDLCEVEMDVHFKMLKTAITLISLDRTCDVLPKGVPSVGLSLGEISVYVHPFVNEDHLGVRAKVDLQCSRLKAYYFTGTGLVKCPFLSLDFTRVFISPVATMMQSEMPAEVEMEAEWVEVKWAPEVLHAIGGAIELGIFAAASFLHESRRASSECKRISSSLKWKTASSLSVPPMRQMVDVAQDSISADEIIVFRCVVKRICAIFPYIYNGQRRVECVTVDTLAVSSEGTTNRLRITIMDARAFPSQRAPDEISSTAKPTIKQAPIRRKSFASHASRNHRKEASASKPRAALGQDSAFLVAECFSIEENRVVGSTQTVVDLFVSGVQLEWDISTQLRVMELIRRITFSAWEMIYRARSTYAIHCTPPESIYNRVHGLNPPLDDIHECLRCESLFPDLISASGDKLHRLHATNLSVNAKLGDKVDVRLSVGVFAGDDLPEVWLFEEITVNVNALEMAVVGSVRVRHTLDKQNEYVFGEFEDMLRKRLLACGRSTDSLDPTLADGIIVEINNCHLRTSCDFPLLLYAEAIQTTFEPFKEQLASAVSSYWRPQQELFYQYFLRTPVVSHQQDLWLRLEDVGFECLGNPLESWLERMYPVWIEELAEQELRAHMLDDHVASLKLTNADLLSDGSYKEMKTLLKEKNARLYIHKVKKLLHETPSGDSGAILNVGIGHIDVDVSFEEDISASWASIQKLDEATQVLEDAFKSQYGHELAHFTPSCLLFMGIQLKTAVTDLTVRMRRFPTPLMTCDGLSVEGQVFVTAFSSGCADPVDLLAALRCFMDLSINVANPVLYFNPGYLFALNELAGLASAFLPLAVFDVDKRFQTSLVDIARRLIHGKIGVTVKDASVRLLCTATSFDSADFLEVSVHRVRVAYSCGSIDVEVTRVAARIEPGSLSHVAELSHLKLQVWLKWECLGNSSLHYLYPVEFVGADSSRISCEHFILRPPGLDEASSPLQVYQATKLSVFINGRICPVGPDNGDSNDGWTKRDMATRTAVVLYSKSVEWLIGFGRIYQNIPQYPLPRRRHSVEMKHTLPSTDILSILEGVTIEEFDLIGLDVALYASEKHPVGLRAFIDDKISCSGAFLRSSHEIFGDGSSDTDTVRRLSLILDDSTWIVHDVNVDAREIQVRVCTPQSGSRGEALVSLKHVSLIVGGGIERAPTHDNGLMKLYSPPPMKRLTNSPPFSFPQPAKGAGEVKERSKQSILEFFHIPYENPFSFRESDSDTEGEIDVREAKAVESEVEELQNLVLDEFRRAGFLLGLLSKEVRVTVTMIALESLVDIADTWVKVAVTSLPELFNGEAETAVLIERKENKEEELDVILEESDPSPKKFTSLAQDPKFSGISLQGGADTPANRDVMQRFEPTPYSNVDTVRPVKRKSTVIVSQLERIRSQEETIIPQGTNAKLAQAFIMVKFEDCQISVQDQLHKGSVLLALNAGTLQHAVSSDSSHERIDLNVDGFQVFTAPLDVDVKSHAIWLKALADGSYCPSSHGLLRQVIAPIPAQVTIWIDREKSIVKNKVKLDIPAIEVQVNLVSKDILEKLTTTVTELVNTKLAQKKKADHSHRLQSYLRGNQHQKRSLNQLVALKKQLKWKIAALEWRQMCGWDYRMNERAMAAVSATESARNLAFEVETSPLFRRRKMSSTSVNSVAPNVSFAGSTSTNRYEDEQFTDELQRMTQQYEGLLELTRFMATELQKQLKPSPFPNVDLEFALDRASLTLSGENVDILRAQVGSLCFKMQLLEDHSGNFALALQDLSVRNLCPGTPYPDMLLPVYSRSWEGDDMFLRIDAEIAKPVGGVTIVQHFEVNVHPIQVCITQEAIMQLVAFFSPSDRANSTKEEQREEVRSQFLQARTASSSVSEGRVGSAIIKAVKVAGKAAAHPLSLGRTHRGDSDDEVVLSGRKAKGGGLQHVAEDPTHWISKLSNLSESNELPIFDEADHHVESAEREINEMKDRAKNSILFKRIRLGAVEVVLTYKNKKSSLASNTPHLHLPHTPQPQALEDMRGFEVKTHALVYCDKACSPLDLLLRIRRDILLDVLSQVGRNFTNIGNFLRDQFDPSRWAAFDALAPLKSLSTTVSSLTAHTGAVVPLIVQPDATNSPSPSENKAKDVATSNTSTPTSVRTSELLCEWQRRSSDLLSDHYDADSSAPSSPTCTDTGHPKQIKAKRSITRLFTRKKSISSPLPSPSTQ